VPLIDIELTTPIAPILRKIHSIRYSGADCCERNLKLSKKSLCLKAVVDLIKMGNFSVIKIKITLVTPELF